MRVGTAKPRNGPIDPREVLPAAARERGDSLAALSRMLGRWPGYLQNFVRDGVPRALSQRDHDLLLAYFGKPMGMRDLWSASRPPNL
jgi:hypothetical protein